jgi:hypothetical protein
MPPVPKLSKNLWMNIMVDRWRTGKACEEGEEGRVEETRYRSSVYVARGSNGDQLVRTAREHRHLSLASSMGF